MWKYAGGGADAVFTNTSMARSGQLGSEVLPYAPSGTVWTAGTSVEVGWAIRCVAGYTVSLDCTDCCGRCWLGVFELTMVNGDVNGIALGLSDVNGIAPGLSAMNGTAPGLSAVLLQVQSRRRCKHRINQAVSHTLPSAL